MASKPQVTLTFAGDATALQKAADKASKATESVGDAAKKATEQIDKGSKSTAGYADRMGKLGAAASGMSAAIGDAGSLVSDLSDLQNRGRERSAAQARALADVEQAGLDAKQALADLRQAQLDLNQAQLDAKQAAADVDQALLDQQQAALDAKQAQADYNTAVKEHGKNSMEARQAALDLAQAQQDLKQAGIDTEQAQADLAQAQQDGKQAALDAAQATRDAKDAQLDLADAQHEADPGQLARWGSTIETVSTAAAGLIGTTNLLAMANNAVSLSSIRAAAATGAAKVATLAGAAATGIATAAQWAWNVAMDANPIGLIIIAVGALVAAIVWIATKTTWFQTAWKASWGAIKTVAVGAWHGIKVGAEAVWNFLKKIPGWTSAAFGKIGNAISWPYRTAFNLISRAWNATVGKLHWTVPGWIPGIGGSSISVPQLPKFHGGGTVPGTPGTEVPIMALAGEEVIPTGQAGRGGTLRIEAGGGGTTTDRAVAQMLLMLLRTGALQLTVRDGRVQPA